MHAVEEFLSSVIFIKYDEMNWRHVNELGWCLIVLDL